MKKAVIIFSVLVFIILIVVVALLFQNNKEETNIETKAEKQIEQLEQKVIAMMNSLNQITLSNSVLIEEKTKKKSNENENTNEDSVISSKDSENSDIDSTKYEIKNDSILVNDDNNIDWDYIKTSIETIHAIWPSLTIDLHELKVNNNLILNFSETLDKLTISAKNEIKIDTINNLASLYDFFPSYIEHISNDNNKINIKYTKASVLNSYAFIEQEKWDEVNVQLLNAINYFTNVLNSVNESVGNRNVLNKIYVLLNELYNCIDLKDKDLYKIKYKNVMELLVDF